MKQLIIIVIIALLSSCGSVFWPGNLTDNGYYSLDDTSIRLIIKHPNDSLDITNDDLRNNLPGKYYKLLSTTNKPDTTHPLGIQIKFWTHIVLKEKGTYYGEYAKNGVLEKIDTVIILFTNETNSFDISPFLKGDSSIYESRWRKYDVKKTPYWRGKSPFFKDISSWIYTMNNKSITLKDPAVHDYIFWLDRKVIKELTFKPAMLQIKITLVDTTGTKRRQLTDFTKIN